MATGGMPERKTREGFCLPIASTVSCMARTGSEIALIPAMVRTWVSIVATRASAPSRMGTITTGDEGTRWRGDGVVSDEGSRGRGNEEAAELASLAWLVTFAESGEGAEIGPIAPLVDSG